ncbi:MAG: hypothetical protein GWP06_10450, partial [Actinobacteria bacterium]|nr:hypothetical protein [Actinomycetota bacterium]
RPETTVLFTRGEGKVSSVSTANNIVGDRAISNPVKAKVSDTKSEHSQTKEKAKAAGTVIPNKKTFGERPETTALFSRGKEKVSGVSTAKNIVEDRAVSDRVKAGVSDAKAEHSQTKEHVGTSANFHAVEKDQVSAKAAESVIPNKRTFHVKPVTIENKAMREKPTVQANPVDRVKTFVPQGNSDGNVIQTHERTSHAILKAHLQGVIRRRWALNNTANSLNGISAATKNSSNALVDASNPASHYSQQSMQSKKDGSQNPGTLLDKTILARFGKHADSAQPSISLFDGFGAGQKITANPVNSIMQNTSTPATVSVLSYWIADGAKLMISRKESFLSVKAESDELGKLVIQMGHENKKFGITIHVQSEQSKMLLENSLPELKQQLAQKDMLLSDIRILINDKPERRFSGGSRSNDKKWQESRKRKTDSKVSQLNDKMAMDIRRIESRWSTYHAVA